MLGSVTSVPLAGSVVAAGSTVTVVTTSTLTSDKSAVRTCEKSYTFHHPLPNAVIGTSPT